MVKIEQFVYGPGVFLEAGCEISDELAADLAARGIIELPVSRETPRPAGVETATASDHAAAAAVVPADAGHPTKRKAKGPHAPRPV